MSQSLSIHQPFRIAAPLSTRQRSLKLALKTGPVVGFFAAHVLIALLLRLSGGAVAILHVAVVLTCGLWWAVMGRRNLVRVAYIGAYITGAEVLWRMTNAPLPWEFGKYATAALFVIAMARNNRFKIPLLPLLYFALLLVSVPLTIIGAYTEETKNLISFYLSGPLALLCCAWFFSHVKLSTGELQRLFLALIGPLIGIAAITLFAGLTTADIEFGNESNRITSGGFAPNQVSAVLGLGAFLALMCVLSGRIHHRLRSLMFAVILFLAVQSAMTFSRGGLYMACGATALALFYLSRDRGSRIKILLVTALLFGVVNFVILPRLNIFTGGALTARFEKKDVTGRDKLLESELTLWAENPLLGVGPGMGKYYQQSLEIGSHTEYTRILSEHGTFGLVAMCALALVGIKNIKRARTYMGHAVVASALVWSLLFMMSAAMRLAAPAFMFGLSFVTLLPDENIGRRFLRRRRSARNRRASWKVP